MANMHAFAGLLALVLIAGVASAQTRPGAETKLLRPNDVIPPLPPGALDGLPDYSKPDLFKDTPDLSKPHVYKPRPNRWGLLTPRPFEYAGWKGESIKQIGSCSAALNNKTDSIHLTVNNDLSIDLAFERSVWHLSEGMMVIADFTDNADKAIDTIEVKSSYSSGTKVILKLTPYDKMMDLLLTSDKIALSSNGVQQWRLSLSALNFGEIYQYLRRCTMKTVMEGFDDKIGAPAVGEPMAGREGDPDRPGVCGGHVEYGWCLSRAPRWHGVKSHSIFIRDSKYIGVPVVWTRLLPNESQKLQGDALYARLKLSSYVIRVHNEGEKKGPMEWPLGSGVAVGPHTLLTNCHVVMEQTKKPKKFAMDKDGKVLKDKDGKDIEIGYSDWEHPYDKNYDFIGIEGSSGKARWPARVVESHCGADIAMLETDADLYPVNGIREFEDLTVGEPVYALGAPQGLAGTFTQGNIANLMSHFHMNKLMPEVDLVISGAAITPGNSGGGLFDQFGNLIALNESYSPEFNGLYFTVAVYQILKR
jgi:hypothetical protein